jgi:MoaA/NifB/PqqE/SkfB family radical SAM enzyme
MINDAYQEYLNNYPQISEIEEMIGFCRCHKHIYIYGTSENCEYLSKYLCVSGVSVEGYVITKTERCQFNVFHLPIFTIDNIPNRESVGILLGLADKYKEYVISILKDTRFDIFRVSDHNRQTIANCLRPQLIEMRQIEVNVTDHCNLNCWGCNHFSNLVEGEHFLDFDEYSRDISHLSEICAGSLKAIKLLGGEPLLHPNIIDFIKVTRNCFPHSNIPIVTNGLLLLKMGAEFWQTLVENNIFLRVTKYPIGVDYKKILKKAVDYGFLNSNLNNNGSFSYDKGHMIMFPFDLSGNQEKYYFINCHHRGCTVLRHGKIYPCPQIAYIDYFNKKFNKELRVLENDYIELHKVKDYNEINKFLSNRVPFCNYCDIKHRYHHKNKFEWGKSTKEIEEYLWK